MHGPAFRAVARRGVATLGWAQRGKAHQGDVLMQPCPYQDEALAVTYRHLRERDENHAPWMEV